MRGTERRARIAVIWVSTTLLMMACSSGGGATPGSSAPPSQDKLQQILDRGTLVLSVDPLYPPQSFAVKGAERAPDTKCGANQLTAPEVAGYDADTGKAVAEALGVEPCFVTPSIEEITSGTWGDRWDITYGSFSLSNERMERLFVTQPYYVEPVTYFVATNSDFQKPSDLDGGTVGVCANCSMDLYLQGKLVIPQQDIVPTVKDPTIARYEIEQPGLEDVESGKIDAFLTQQPVGQQAIRDGMKLRELQPQAFYAYSTGLVDKNAGADQARFIERVNAVVLGLIQDGTLAPLSEKYFHVDYASKAADFDMSALQQEGL